jgi:lysine-ketoglutarate reductase/saccharopine dehydrogenase-like protein (TIGR00300 family)
VADSTPHSVVTRAVGRDRCLPDDFYAATSAPTSVWLDGRWVDVDRPRTDGVIVLDKGRASCRSVDDLREGDLVVCGTDGIRVGEVPGAVDRWGLASLPHDISSEHRVDTAVDRVAAALTDIKSRSGSVVVVAGPVVVHVGGGPFLCQLIHAGFVDVLLAGNALAVHDVEQALYGTSLGVDLESGQSITGGHRHHMRAINAIARAGSLRAAVTHGVLTSGVMYECIRHDVPFVLAGSIRDDGPLPDTVMDVGEAQRHYAAAIRGADLVLVLSTMLHGAATRHMLPATVPLVCVDINPAVVSKVLDGGPVVSVGVVTDVGLFLQRLAERLRVSATHGRS